MRPAALIALVFAWPCVASANLPDAARGSYVITVFFPESDGSSDTSSEDWTEPMQTEMVNGMVDACAEWMRIAPASVEFSCQVQYVSFATTPTQYEPITRLAGRTRLGFLGGDDGLWVNDVMDATGSSSIFLDYLEEVEAYNDAQQETNDTDEAISAFMVNSLNDPDGMFANAVGTYVPFVRAPYLVLPWDAALWRSIIGSAVTKVTAGHEMAHLFGAQDEYRGADSCDATSNGYSNGNHDDCDGERVTCLMNGNDPCDYNINFFTLCYWTRGQIGWPTECEPYGVCGDHERFECSSSITECIAPSEVCDGHSDCSDGSDESASCAACEGAVSCPGGTCAARIEDCPAVPETWLCSPELFDAGTRCDCECGADDPDCEDSSAAVFGCDPGSTCMLGHCVDSNAPSVPSEWTCEPSYYGTLDGCDCQCGAPDPDCVPGAQVFGCGEREVCDQDRCVAPTASNVPTGWTCERSYYGTFDGCDCECGAPDPDCVHDTEVFGCDAPAICDQGRCVDPTSSEVPAEWTCAPSAYNADDACNCQCGAPDPDCMDPALDVLGCPSRDRCANDVCIATRGTPAAGCSCHVTSNATPHTWWWFAWSLLWAIAWRRHCLR